jgi:hypothetical protein
LYTLPFQFLAAGFQLVNGAIGLTRPLRCQLQNKKAAGKRRKPAALSLRAARLFLAAILLPLPHRDLTNYAPPFSGQNWGCPRLSVCSDLCDRNKIELPF